MKVELSTPQEVLDEQIAHLAKLQKELSERQLATSYFTGAKEKKHEGNPNGQPHRTPMSIGELAVRGRLG